MNISGFSNLYTANMVSNLNYQKKFLGNFGRSYNNGDIYVDICDLRQQAHEKRIAEENRIIEKGKSSNANIKDKEDARDILMKRKEEELRGLDYPENIIQDNLRIFGKQVNDLLNLN